MKAVAAMHTPRGQAQWVAIAEEDLRRTERDKADLTSKANRSTVFRDVLVLLRKSTSWDHGQTGQMRWLP